MIDAFPYFAFSSFELVQPILPYALAFAESQMAADKADAAVCKSYKSYPIIHQILKIPGSDSQEKIQLMHEHKALMYQWASGRA
jgi:hypothetical protein